VCTITTLKHEIYGLNRRSMHNCAAMFMAVKFASAIDAASWSHLERAEIGLGLEQAATLQRQGFSE
jgi:hypothetical protein